MSAQLSEIAARLERLPITRWHWMVLIVASFALFFDTIDTTLTGLVLAVVRPLWDFPVVWIGIVTAVGLGGFWVGAVLAGVLGDRYGRLSIITYTLVLYSLFSALRGFTHGIGSLLILNTLTYVFIGAESSIVPPYLAELWPSGRRGQFSGWMMAFFAFGFAFTPVLTLYVIPHLGWQWTFFVTAPIALFAGVLRWYLPESPRWLAGQGRYEQALRVLERIEQTVRAQSGGELPRPQAAGPAPEAKATGISALLSREYLRRTIMLWVAWFGEYGVLYSFLTFVPTLLILSNVGIIKSLQFSAIIYAGYIPGYILAGYVADAIDRKWTIVLAFLMTAVFGTGFGLSTAVPAVLTFGGLTAFAIAMGSTAIYTYTPELYPTEVRATGMGVASSWGRVGSIALLLVFGIFAVLKGKLFLFLVADALLVVGIVVVAALGPATRGRTLEATAQGER